MNPGVIICLEMAMKYIVSAAKLLDPVKLASSYLHIYIDIINTGDVFLNLNKSKSPEI